MMLDLDVLYCEVLTASFIVYEPSHRRNSTSGSPRSSCHACIFPVEDKEIFVSVNLILRQEASHSNGQQRRPLPSQIAMSAPAAPVVTIRSHFSASVWQFQAQLTTYGSTGTRFPTTHVCQVPIKSFQFPVHPSPTRFEISTFLQRNGGSPSLASHCPSLLEISTLSLI